MGFHASVLRMSTSTVPWSRSEAVATVTTHLLIAHHMIYTLPGNGKAARASSGRSTGTGIDHHDHRTGCPRRARFPHGARSGTTARCESAAVGSEQARSGEVRDHRGVFDGQLGAIRLTSRLDHPPGTVHQTTANVDAQNLARTFYRGKSTFLL